MELGCVADGITIIENPRLALASLIARRNCACQLSEAIQSHWEADLPATPRTAEGKGVRFIWAGPERWLAASADMSGAALVVSLRKAAGDLASVCDQSDSRILLAISGPHARDMLAKCVPIDLHPTTFGIGDTAITLAGHVGCQIWQTDDKPTYALAIPRSYEECVRAWLGEAAGEFAEG